MNRPVESDYTSLTAYTRALEAYCDSLQPKQKPVAWLEPEWGEKICPEVGYEVTMTDDHPRDLCWIPLYAHPLSAKNKAENIGCLGMPVNVPVTPPQRWVGLTEEEVDEIYTSVQEEVTEHWDKGGTTMMFPFTLYKAIEQALKEKNT